MSTVLEINNRQLTGEDIIPLLASYRLLPRLMFELIVDEAIASFTCTPEETENAYRDFCQQQQITEEQALQVWLIQNAMTKEQLEIFVSRKLKIEKFKEATWGNKLESYFLRRKRQFDKVVYSLIQTTPEIAHELYFRIQEGESSFAELACEYSQGSEAKNGGLIGPVELSTCPPAITKLLSVSRPGQLLPPIAYGNSYLVIRLEKFISAQLNETMRQRLLSELFASWLQDQYKQKYNELKQKLLSN
jgi:parvulin-like peptidyl-prolyl isomerase